MRNAENQWNKPLHSAVYNAKCGRPQGKGRWVWSNAGTCGQEEGCRKTCHILRTSFMDDPFRGSVSGHRSILGFGSLDKVKNHCSRAKALVNLKSATHRYHTLITAAKKKYYSSLIHSSSTNPRHLWRAVNSLLHRKSSSPLPSSIPSPSIC